MASEKSSRAKLNPHVWINSSNLMGNNSQSSISSPAWHFFQVPLMASMPPLFSFPLEEEYLPPKIMLRGCTAICPDLVLPSADLVVTFPDALDGALPHGVQSAPHLQTTF